MSWLSQGLNSRVVERVRAIIADSTVDKDEFDLFVTGESRASIRVLYRRRTFDSIQSPQEGRQRKGLRPIVQLSTVLSVSTGFQA